MSWWRSMGSRTGKRLQSVGKIAIHPVRAGEKHSVVPVIEGSKNGCARETSDDGADTNMF